MYLLYKSDLEEVGELLTGTEEEIRAKAIAKAKNSTKDVVVVRVVKQFVIDVVEKNDSE